MKWRDIKKESPPEGERCFFTDGERGYAGSKNLLVKTPEGEVEIPANHGAGAVIKGWLPDPQPLPLPAMDEEQPKR